MHVANGGEGGVTTSLYTVENVPPVVLLCPSKLLSTPVDPDGQGVHVIFQGVLSENLLDYDNPTFYRILKPPLIVQYQESLVFQFRGFGGYWYIRRKEEICLHFTDSVSLI